MKCCGSPITSTAPNTEPARARGRDVAADFNALLIGVAFKPLAAAMGFYGDLVVGTASRAIAREEHGGHTHPVERAVEAAGRTAAESAR
jgi:hypothetical protein